MNCERSFSSGSQNVSRFRHSLSDRSVRTATVLGSWASVGLVPEEDIIEGIRSKGPCWRVKEEEEEEEDDNDDIVEVMDVEPSN